MPLVSIIIPASNSEFFHLALKDAVSQTYSNIEVIVCDDSLTDEIRQACELFRGDGRVPIHYVRNPQPLGFAANLGEGLRHARGELVKFLCDDDRLYSECVRMQAEPMRDHPGVTLVVAQRYFCDRSEVRLPGRLDNVPVSPCTALFKGEDLLGIFETFTFNFLGNLSSSLFRRSELETFLPALIQPSHCFTILLDLALFVCMLRRGDLVAVNDVLVVERLHPQRYSRQQAVRDEQETQRSWLVQMLKQRSGEPAPAKGWVRYVPLELAGQQPRRWEELCLDREIGRRQGVLPYTVGSNTQSFAELYQEWLSCRDLSAYDRQQLPDIIGRWPQRARIVPVVLDEHGDAAALAITLQSLAAQHYPAEATLVLSAACAAPTQHGTVLTLPLQGDGVAQTNQLLADLDNADWVYLLRAGDRLITSALLVLADRIAMSGVLRCLYSDEGALLDGESLEPAFKPDFNLDLLRSYPYVGRTLAFERAHAMAVGGLDARYGEMAAIDLLWKLFEQHGRRAIGHASEVLVESQLSLGMWLASAAVCEQNSAVLCIHLQRLGIEFDLPAVAGLLNRPRYLHAHTPLVSIVIVSADQVALAQRCVEQLLANTLYGHFEVLLVDNGSVSPQAKAWFAGMAQLGGDKLRVLSTPALPQAAAQNFAAEHARGEYLLMLSPHLVVIRGDWLEEMLHLAQRPEVAVVGAKLLNPDGLVQHAGLVLGLRAAAGVPFLWEAADAPGYMQRLQVVQSLSAVGIDCLLVRREVFATLGGFDTEHYPAGSQEVDLCLRAGDLGYLTLWTPQAQLAFIGKRVFSENERAQAQAGNDTLLQRWLSRIARDPAYNPNLSLGGTSYTLEAGLRAGWSPFSNRGLPSVLVLPINAGAVGHYRVIQPLHELLASGRATGHVYYDLPSIVEIARQRPDVIVLQGRYYAGADEEVRKLRRYFDCRFIYELDDLVSNVPKRNDHARGLLATIGQVVADCIAQCDRVVVSTEALGNALSHTHTDIRVVPNMLAPELWSHQHSTRRTSRKPRVGWGGGTSHRGDLELIADVVRELADEVDWVFFGMCPPGLLPYVHEFHGLIGLAAYPAKLASLNLDLALAPLEFHLFNDCKSNLRLLEYGACGYPVVVSDTGAYGGYLPCTRVKTNSTEEWLEAIRSHLRDPEASYRMGDSLREVVLRDYMLRGDNVQHWADAWLGA